MPALIEADSLVGGVQALERMGFGAFFSAEREEVESDHLELGVERE